MILEYFSLVLSVVQWLFILGLVFLALRFIAQRIQSPLAVAAFDCLLAEKRNEQPGMTEAEVLVTLRRDPQLVVHAIEAFARRHPELPRFSGGWKFRLALRRQVEMADKKVGKPDQARPSLVGPVAGVALVVLGLPALVGGTLFAIENGTGGAANTDRSIEVFYVAFTAIGAVGALLGATLCLAGLGLVVRYRRLKGRLAAS
ncbi:MAG: hypothetical protein ACM31D_02885 [Bacteroidota bacterium]